MAGFSFMAGLLLASVCWGKYSLLFAVLTILSAVPFACLLRKYSRFIAVATVFLLLGIAYSSLYTQRVYNRITDLDGKNVTVKGYIKDFEYLGSETCLVTVKGKIEDIKGTVSFYAPLGDFDYYDKIEASFKAEKITNSVNFLSENYNRPKGIYIQGGEALQYKVGKNCNPVFREIAHYRDYCLGNIKVNCGKQEGEFLSAMLCGDKSELSQADKTRSYRCGIGHLLAVSGAHLVILVSLISFALKGLHNKKSEFLLTMIIVWGFALFSGLSVSVLRAAVLVTLLKSAFIFGRKADALNSLGICAIILNIGCPYTVRSSSFLLTFSAAFVMEILVPEITAGIKCKFSSAVKTLITYQTIMFAMLPLNIWLFGGVSVISPLTNLVCAPVCTVAMVFGFLFLCTGCWAFFAPLTINAADKLMHFALRIINFSADLPYCYIYVKYTVVNILLFIACIFWIFYAFKSKSSYKILSLGTIMLITAELFYIVFNLSGKDRNKCEICVIPGGYGCEYVLNTSDCTIIFDYGSKGKSNSGAARYLDENGTEDIDFAFLLDGEYDYTQFKSDFACTPEFVFLDGYIKGDDNVMKFDTGSYFSRNNFSVTSEDKGYMVKYGDFTILLSRKYFIIDDKKYKALNESGAMIIDIDSRTVRRVDHGFN